MIEKLKSKNSIRLYHSTDFKNLDKTGIDVKIGSTRTDFGLGFYLTTNYEQAEEWAKKLKKEDKGYVYVYEINKISFERMTKLHLTKFNSLCITILCECRLRGDDSRVANYDVVYGVMADSRTANIIMALSMYEDGKLSLEETVRVVR